MSLTIPGYKTVDIQNVLFDYNGTLASGGRVSASLKQKLSQTAARYRTFVITADTFGTVAEELAGTGVEVTVLQSGDHTAEKADFLHTLGSGQTVALGNGNNDRQMLAAAGLSIALIGDEGCAVQTMLAADIVCSDIGDAMDLLLDERRLIATLRR